jgi:phospholipid/cholesterol/gamma-HCH transport system permease protein
MATDAAEPLGWHSPLGWLGRTAIASVAYLGGAAIVLASAARSIVRRTGAGPAFVPALMWQFGRVLGLGLPLVGLVHVGLGSFLSMQAYFGGTFVDGTGAVVGIGLIRNVAPLVSGMVLAGFLAPLYITELRARTRAAADRPDAAPLDTGRLAAARIAAATLAGPIMGFWGWLVGILVGWRVAQSLLGVSTSMFVDMFTEMLWARDVLGVVVKGGLFGLFGALFACHEGLRGGTPESTATDSVRSICLAGLAIMVFNSTWFLLVYHAGPPFGPTLLAPPTL